LKLVWHEEFATIQEACAFERQIKGWSRAKKEVLIRGDFKLLHDLAQSKEMRERRRKRGSGS
jgi:predicted GIY-YIG superfamily endonuclease